MNGLGELVQVIGLAGLTVAGLIVGWVVAARLKSAVAELEDIILNSLLVLAGIWLGVLVGGLLYILATTLPRSAQLALLAVVAMAVSGGTWWAFKEGGGE